MKRLKKLTWLSVLCASQVMAADNVMTFGNVKVSGELEVLLKTKTQGVTNIGDFTNIGKINTDKLTAIGVTTLNEVTAKSLNVTGQINAAELIGDVAQTISIATPTDNSALIGDYLANNAGLEVIEPFWQTVDSNKDGKLDSVNSYFVVYQAGTLKKLLTTLEKSYALPVSACKNPLWQSRDTRSSFKRLGTTLVHIRTYATRCREQGTAQDTDTYTNYVYGVDLADAQNSVWFKLIAGELSGVGVLPDNNANGTDELLLTVVNSLSKKQSNQAFYLYDGKTGEALVEPKAYPLTR